ncbi:hypothetical protein NDA16_004245 [Ustilago loliicola]|nr:hypothetical protein NDA16_004245 [Ustilago loliicola]
MSSFPQQCNYVDSGRFHCGYDREEYPYHDQPETGVMSSKVRCDGKKPSCGLCSRLAHVTCVYVKVTAEQNAILREKKRRSKQRKNAEQEAARANFHEHDTFLAYHPYRNTDVPAQPGSFWNGSFASSVIDDINSQRVGAGRGGMPNAPALPQTSVLQLYQPQQQSSAACFYDGRYQAGQSTSTGANALFDVGAGLNGASRRPSVMTPYAARKQSLEATSVTTAAASAWSRASEPRCSVSSSTSSYRYDTMLSDATTTSGGLNILTPTPNTSYYTNQATFRTEPEPQRYMSAFAPQPCFENQTSPPLPTPAPTQLTGGYFDHNRNGEGFRPSSSSPLETTNQHYSQQSLSPNSTVASPCYLATLPSLERAPSSTDSRSAASPETCPQHTEDNHAVWGGGGGEQKKTYWPSQQQNWETSATAAGHEVSTWATHINPSASVTNGKNWDPVSIYLQQ